MTEQTQLIQMLNRAAIGYGMRTNPDGDSVMIETNEDDPMGFTIAEFQFDEAGNLKVISTYPGDE